MANAITLAQKYVPLLDEVYAVSSKTSVLDIDKEMVRQGATANTILIPDILLQGLGDYNRNTGFVSGDVTFNWTPYQFTQDRGRTFSVDSMDNEETIGLAFGKLAGEFIRTQVAPEIDAYRIGRYATTAINAGNTAAAVLAANTVIPAIDTAALTMNDNEVPEENRVLFVSNTTYNLMKQSSDFTRRFDVQTDNGNVNRKIEYFDEMQVVKVPSARFFEAFTFLDGVTPGQEAGGFTPAALADAINFMIVHKGAVSQVVKTALPRIFDPATNQTADAWKFDYRCYHDAWVLSNKTNGIYVHTVA